MAFDADQFRKDAEAAGYSSEVIEAAIAKQSGRPTIGPAENQGMMADVMSQLPAGAQTLPKDAEKYLYGAGGLAALGGAYGLYKAYQAHQDRALDRQMKQLQIMQMQRDLGVAAPVAPNASAATAAVPPTPGVTISGGKATPEQLAAFDAQFKAGTGQAPATSAPVDRNTLAQQRIAAGQAAGLGVQPSAGLEPVTPPIAEGMETTEQWLQRMDQKYGPLPTESAPAVPAEVAPIAEEAPHTAVALEEKRPGSQVAEAVVKDELVKPETKVPTGAAEPPARTGSGQPAFPGGGAERARMPRGGEFASAADVPKSMAFVPGAQYYDSLANAIRSRPAAQAVVQQYGRYPASDAEARSWAADYLKSTGAPTRETMLAEGKKPDTVTGIFKEIGANKKKLAKMGGVAGALVSIADLANAKTTEEKMNAGLGVLGAIVPPGLDVLPAGAPTVPQARIEESALLGSPYAQTEWAKYMRLRERAGAGRGLVNPR